MRRNDAWTEKLKSGGASGKRKGKEEESQGVGDKRSSNPKSRGLERGVCH